MSEKTCSICQRSYTGHGHNLAPAKADPAPSEELAPYVWTSGNRGSKP